MVKNQGSKNRKFFQCAFLNKNCKGWIKIVEAFIAILLIASALLIVIGKGYVEKDISSEVYEIELSVLREIELDNSLRNIILDRKLDIPIDSNNADFPIEIMNKINSRIPDYLICEAKICAIDEICFLEEYPSKDIYAQSVAITATATKYDPRQLKLFCWSE